MIFKEHPEKKERETYKKVVSPASYRVLDAYKKSQMSRGSLLMPKGDRVTMLCNFKRNTSFI